ncbi:isoprenylcysteine carboxylmethyltransferase family protein [uncultured Croceicoccus sp.]|uniref:isoprenylcysteine carboxyl methyltransferase family protein n=1 Tax=uncultured Croceicoccus sp. TaxID=1295329 RepID=UPI002617357D|nr:isoprenylcysteine carboxylmethyltransferase family protein [uncultured Croceicoccus sp.]
MAQWAASPAWGWPAWDWPAWAGAVLAYVVASRLGELVYARRNTQRLLAEGGTEHYPGHYPLFIVLHGSWLLAILLFARPGPEPSYALASLFAFSQAARYWVLHSIGRWWTTRIISAPHFPRVRRGPYRFFPHPNYAVVVAEIALLPLLLGAPWVALVWSVLNAMLLAHRIRLEEKALALRAG